MTNDLRLIEKGFPCHQVGAETQRERGASSALPPLYFLHVWWARRPLTPSRAAILASLLPADTDPNLLLRELGLERPVVWIDGVAWRLSGKVADAITRNADGSQTLMVDAKVQRAFADECNRRAECRATIAKMRAFDAALAEHPILDRWEADSAAFPTDTLKVGAVLPVDLIPADPAHVNERIEFAKGDLVKDCLGSGIRWDPEDLYGYDRGYTKHPTRASVPKVVLDPTSGGGSIPFEALRLGHKVIANELNPVATTILYATLDYPARYGIDLAKDIEEWGQKLVAHVDEQMRPFTPFSPLDDSERAYLKRQIATCPEVLPQFDVPEYDQQGLLYVRTVTCPHCGGEAPLFNTFWLSKEAGDPWAVEVITEESHRKGAKAQSKELDAYFLASSRLCGEKMYSKRVAFKPYRITGKLSKDETARIEAGTVTRGIGSCVHCKQGIDGDEIKAQARGESPRGTWRDVLYTIAAVRFEPKLDEQGKPEIYGSGDRRGEIKTRKVRFFRAPNARDLQALADAKAELQRRWDAWDREGLIPTEQIPPGHRRDQRDGIINFGIDRWSEMFTPRQFLGHLHATQSLLSLKQDIINAHGKDRARAIITYLQFAIDKCLDYNSRHTRWEYTRGIVKGTFGRHDFSLKWTFGEMVFAGPGTGLSWGLSQVYEGYLGIANLVEPNDSSERPLPPTINNGTAASMQFINDTSVDLICMDPPYYNNVQYAELSDFYYVWHKRTLKDVHPHYRLHLTDKKNEAVANPYRDGGNEPAKIEYQRLMAEIFVECERVLQPNGLFSLMFTHKTQDAWETLTRALIDAGWIITSSFPVDSESAHSTHQMGLAAAASSIFIACRKRPEHSGPPAIWAGFGAEAIQVKVRKAVEEGLREFAPLKLNPVDEMVASYGRALKVLSEAWPVLDGNEEVSPLRAMNEASRVVAHHHIAKLTKGSLSVADLMPEAAFALTCFGIWGLNEFAFDDALSLSKSLTIRLEGKSGGYHADGPFIGMATAEGGRGAKKAAADASPHAPLIRKGNKLRLAKPDERNPTRVDKPQTEWDILHGILMAHRAADIIGARAYLAKHAAGKERLLTDLLTVWAAEVGDQSLQREAQSILYGMRG